jgi:hypothetical protein
MRVLWYCTAVIGIQFAKFFTANGKSGHVTKEMSQTLHAEQSEEWEYTPPTLNNCRKSKQFFIIKRIS